METCPICKHAIIQHSYSTGCDITACPCGPAPEPVVIEPGYAIDEPLFSDTEL